MNDLLQRVWRMLAACIALVAVGLPLEGRGNRASAQTETGVICVATFDDANANGIHDAGELPLAGVNVNLATGGAIIATHILADGEESYCFKNLLPGTYTVTFTDSPLYRATTAREGTFALSASQRLTIDAFGAFPIGPEGLRDVITAQAVAADTTEPLDVSTRLLLATGGATLIMLVMIGLGTVMLALLDWRGRRTRRGRPEPAIAPPPPEFLRPPEG